MEALHFATEKIDTLDLLALDLITIFVIKKSKCLSMY